MAPDERHMSAYEAWTQHSTGLRTDPQLTAKNFLAATYPEYHITRTTPFTCDLMGYASAGFACANPEHDAGVDITRGYLPPRTRLDTKQGELIEDVKFGRWTYAWQGQEFVLYQIHYMDGRGRPVTVFFILSLRNGEDSKDGHHAVIDSLILAASKWTMDLHEEIYVFDNQMWRKDKSLYRDVKGSSWDDVILDPAMKVNLVRDVSAFFDARDLYKSMSVPWKRGVIFHGVPGNGKTVSLKALINSLSQREDPVPALYVKSFDGCNGEKYSIQSIFSHARSMAPCLLIFEDLDSLVVDKCRSYFLNEVDGLESNDGILMIGSTNHLDRLDPAITKRPSRFDRKYHFKFADSTTVDFPDEICQPIAAMTEDFSFAYLKELFVSSLLELARVSTADDEDAGDAAEAETPPSGSTSITESVLVEQPDAGSKDAEKDTTESGQDSKEEDQKEAPKKAKRIMPEVTVPEAVKDNALLKIVTRQARTLLDKMDNTEDEPPRSKTTTIRNPMNAMARLRGMQIQSMMAC